MPPLENNITAVKLRIESACLKVDRPIADVSLLAVSKTRSAKTLKLAYLAGLRQFGENYVSEAQEKIPQLPADIIWHFIGPIQSNKSRIIAENFSWVQSLDRIKLVQRLNNQRPEHLPPLQCLIQVNISEEEQKAGIAPDQVETLAKAIINSPRLTLRGLMAIPKVTEKAQENAAIFAKMTALFNHLKTLSATVDTLSMGMSQDMDEAIAQGSTMVRIGTDLFGPRN
ncbi:MAG: YggS family pyridoxal phosphate-dependent enzyme [Pseudomonadales bacterium]|nr:YggS family pyridoxal phosphate-dependent enzyme [Pseudomonadales bacterium]